MARNSTTNSLYTTFLNFKLSYAPHKNKLPTNGIECFVQVWLRSLHVPDFSHLVQIYNYRNMEFSLLHPIKFSIPSCINLGPNSPRKRIPWKFGPSLGLLASWMASHFCKIAKKNTRGNHLYAKNQNKTGCIKKSHHDVSSWSTSSRVPWFNRTICNTISTQCNFRVCSRHEFK